MATRQKTGGRQKGTVNKVPWELREMASVYTPEALETLGYLMLHGRNEAVRISAANSLLDRAHGKPAQAITGPEGGQLGLVLNVITGVDRPDDDRGRAVVERAA